MDKLRLSVIVLSMISCCSFAQHRFPDSITVPASTRYNNLNLVKRVFLGANYRQEWSVPVKMPVFDICDPQHGYTITGIGGGQQTKSLQLRDNAGKEWALRTVDKDVTDEALPPGIRKGIFYKTIKKIVQDMVSAAHPYAALTIPVLSEATGVLTGSQQLFLVPDDSALGKYRADFANRVCILEQRTLPGLNPETEDTEVVLDSILTDNDHHILQEEVLRARLLDMLIADWDRHPGQWKWATLKKGTAREYLIIPRDRDQAYFNSNGLLIKITSKFTSRRHMFGFKEKSNKLKNLNYKSWQFDQIFLNKLDRETWERIATEFCRKLPDSVIRAAIRQLPPEIYRLSGEIIESKLRNRRDGLVKNVMKYYSFHAANVTIYGTEEAEYFHVISKGGKIEVSVFNKNPGHDSSMIYRRLFDPEETKTIYLVGFGAQDHYKLNEGANGIRFIINTKKGEDVFNIAPGVKVKVNE